MRDWQRARLAKLMRQLRSPVRNRRTSADSSPARRFVNGSWCGARRAPVEPVLSCRACAAPGRRCLTTLIQPMLAVQSLARLKAAAIAEREPGEEG